MFSSIRSRLLSLMLVAVLGGLATALGGLWALWRIDETTGRQLQQVSHGMHSLVLIESAGMEFKKQVQEWKNILLRGNDPDSFAKYKKQFGASADKVQSRLTELSARLQGGEDLAEADPGRVQRIAALMAAHAKMRETYLSALSSFDPQDPDAGKKVDRQVKGVDRAATEEIESLIALVEKEELAYIDRERAALHEANVGSRVMMGAVVGVAALAVLLIAVSVVRRISKALKAMESGLASIRSELDLTRALPTEGRDEFARISASVNTLLQEFRGILRRLSDDAGRVSGTSTRLAGSVGSLSDSVDQQNQSTESMAASVEELAVSVNHVSESAEHAEKISSRSAELARRGAEVIERTINDMLAMTETVKRSEQTVRSLSDRSREIGSVTNMINELAEQTNLLALNAAIEAARAGEQGRGFAVVADEVRKLAERTAAATKQISVVVSAIESEAETATSVMDRAIHQVAANAEGAREAGSAIDDIRRGAHDVVSVSHDISAALNEQKLAGDSIARRVEAIATLSEENANALGEVRSASQALDKLSMEMHAIVARFRV